MPVCQFLYDYMAYGRIEGHAVSSDQGMEIRVLAVRSLNVAERTMKFTGYEQPVLRRTELSQLLVSSLREIFYAQGIPKPQRQRMQTK